MKPTEYQFRAAPGHEPKDSGKWTAVFAVSIILLAATVSPTAEAETRPHYGGTLRIMMQSFPATLDLSPNATPAEYRDMTRLLTLVGDTLVKLDAQGEPKPSLAVSWTGPSTGRVWQFTLRRGLKFQDGSAASPAAIAQILGILHPEWTILATANSMEIEPEPGTLSLLAELALPRNILLKRSATGIPIGTGPFLVAEWQPGKFLKLVANEDSWGGRPFLDATEITFGKPLRDQTLAMELSRSDLIERPPASKAQDGQTSQSFPIELMALVFPANSKAQDPRVREALALAIDRKPIQAILLKNAGEPTAAILPNWLTGYDAAFSALPNLQRARVLLADSRLPAFHLSYDPRDPEDQLIAERIALNAREVGITLQVSLSGMDDIRLMRVAVPSSDPVTSLDVVARQLGLNQPAFVSAHDISLQDLYSAERNLLSGFLVIPLFHLPVATAASPGVRGFEPDHLGNWDASGTSVADAWLTDSHPPESRPAESKSAASP